MLAEAASGPSVVFEEKSSSLAAASGGGGPLGGGGWVRRSWGGASLGTESKLGASARVPAVSILPAAVSALLSPGGGVRCSPDFPFFPFGRQGLRDLRCLPASRRHWRVNRLD